MVSPRLPFAINHAFEGRKLRLWAIKLHAVPCWHHGDGRTPRRVDVVVQLPLWTSTRQLSWRVVCFVGWRTLVLEIACDNKYFEPRADISFVRRSFCKIGWGKPAGYFHRCYQQQQLDEIIMYVAHETDHYIGHVKLVWRPDYPHFRDAGIPEIQDLNVLPVFRKQGIGTALIRACEERAVESVSMIGIGVGLHPGYNNAQRLYSKLGYILDGHGVHYAQHTSD